MLEHLATSGGLDDVPVVVQHIGELDATTRDRLHELKNIVTLREAPSLERVYDDTTLFLHRPTQGRGAELEPRDARPQRDPILAGRRVLVIDDDVRNLFAVSAALEAQEMNVLHADNGRDGVAQLEANPDIELVLMDIMMPEMDGYQTMQAIRSITAFEQLPIIALTAKALAGDREKAVAAGASDYVTKPVDIDRLLSVIRVWLTRSAASSRRTTPSARQL
jgi:CheY-like chemotaxis protein